MRCFYCFFSVPFYSKFEICGFFVEISYWLDLFYYLCSMEQILREMIEMMVGRKMVVPRDFAWLSEKVEERTQQRVSASTLRRFWGYVSEGVSASKFTKNVLANFLGYADFEEFGLSQGTGERQSQMVIDKEISCDDLYEGQMLKLSWLPDRTCIIRYQGNGSFKVVSSENTRLAKDDTFECRHFINHEPAYLHGWKHGDREPVTYAIGKKNGIIVEHYLED